MKVKVPILLIFLFVIASSVSAQDTILRKYNRFTDFPKFWIIGVEATNFPNIKNNCSSADSLKYGENILKWIEANVNLNRSIMSAPSNYINISYLDFKKFDARQIALFEEILSHFEPVLVFQKKRIKQLEKEQEGIKNKGNEKAVPQVYLLNKAELINWKKRLEI